VQARWKYVVHLDGDGDEVIEVFEPAIIHASYLEKAGISRGRLVSAGFATAAGECYGHSTSLGIKSRPAADSALFREARG
jgi:hypothetical protein